MPETTTAAPISALAQRLSETGGLYEVRGGHAPNLTMFYTPGDDLAYFQRARILAESLSAGGWYPCWYVYHVKPDPTRARDRCVAWEDISTAFGWASIGRGWVTVPVGWAQNGRWRDA